MGTGFSIDTPLRVAKYGISSVISLVDDVLIEQMRKFHSERLGLPYTEITHRDENARAARVTAYLNLLDDQVRIQVKNLQASPFEPGSEITRYFELLPDCPLKTQYAETLRATDLAQKTELQDALRGQAVPGSIDVNIMTKVDRDLWSHGVKLPPERSDAMSALRGFATSSLQSSIIFSAGINRRLFGYLGSFDDFFPDVDGHLRKRIILKVSDYRSAHIQGRYLAKRGLWVSEYRIESGLNCGGHAFATDGLLMGPILEEFRRKKSDLIGQLHEEYTRALSGLKRAARAWPFEVRITVQGGIGTAEENTFLLEHYGVDGTGWGTPFLLVPEVTNVDQIHLERLAAAGANDVYLSDRSPLGVPFWSLRSSDSEHTHTARIMADHPGSPCPKGYVSTNAEFTDIPICPASRAYQRRKLEQLAGSELPETEKLSARDKVLVKSCICHDLAGSVTLMHGIDSLAHPAVCCGPNIANFNRVASLEEMVGHIYGKISLLTDTGRPHMFIRELSLYLDYLRKDIEKSSSDIMARSAQACAEIKANLVSAIDYYHGLAAEFSQEYRDRFERDLDAMFAELEELLPAAHPVVLPGVAS